MPLSLASCVCNISVLCHCKCQLTATDNFADFGPPYKGPAVIHMKNDGEPGVTNSITADAEAAKEL